MTLPDQSGFEWSRWALGCAKVSSTVRHARKVIEACCEQYPQLLRERDAAVAERDRLREEVAYLQSQVMSQGVIYAASDEKLDKTEDDHAR